MRYRLLKIGRFPPRKKGPTWYFYLPITPSKYYKLELGSYSTMYLVRHNQVTDVTRETHTGGAKKLWVSIGYLLNGG